ncbi:cell division protein ZapA [Sulfobacillus harzensis]|uniref:Cell division protein ZapA n=1 Tax=Sulfobacillus harzensis TaxID=2729629 RepID=A0A7Y0Q3N7_9FIRM|nr:cell division protein ZapA [Sulfobacillus harzensis]
MGEQIRTTVTIYGEDYSLVGDLPEDVVKALAYHVDNRIRVLASKNPRVSLNRLAVLTALNIAEEFFELQEQHQELISAMQQQWRSKREVKDATK